MLSILRKRFTLTNLGVVAALVFAMSGGAYAASKFVITSTKQISPSVLKALKGKSGKNGTAGATGPAGLAGPTGPTGATGPAGSMGSTGSTGSSGATGSAGPEGSPWTAGGTLPSKATEKGTWVALRTASAAKETLDSPISFTIPLAKGLSEAHVHYFLAGEKGVGGGCPTTSEASKPEAEAGNLCIFAATEENSRPPEGLTQYAILDPENSEEPFNTGGRTGVAVQSQSLAAGEVKAYGTWAVTAP